MVKWTFGNKKIMFKDTKDFYKQLNEILYINILHIEDDIPDFTDTKFCKTVYYEFKHTIN